MLKRLAIDLGIVLGVATFFIGAQLLSNYIHYGTFLF